MKQHNKLIKAYAILRIKGKEVKVPVILDPKNNYAYFNTPSEAGNVDVVRWSYKDILFNPVNMVPGFKYVSLAQHRRSIPEPMSTKEATGTFAKVRPEVAEALKTAREELIANGPNIPCA